MQLCCQSACWGRWALLWVTEPNKGLKGKGCSLLPARRWNNLSSGSLESFYSVAFHFLVNLVIWEREEKWFWFMFLFIFPLFIMFPCSYLITINKTNTHRAFFWHRRSCLLKCWRVPFLILLESECFGQNVWVFQQALFIQSITVINLAYVPKIFAAVSE